MTLPAEQVVLAASTSGVAAWDLETGTYLTTYKYKGTDATRQGLTTLGTDYLVATEQGKAQALVFWAWHREQIQQRCFMPEPMASVACTSDGVYCVGGSASGNIYIWEAGSGRLLRSWPAHYKAVSALAFSDDGAILVSGGSDAVVHVWLLMDLLDSYAQADAWNNVPQPLHSWSEHTLPVTDILVGVGATMAASTSLDRTCKIYSLAQGQLLRTVSLPAALYCVAVDPWEHNLYLGSSDGRIFEVSLVGRRREPQGEEAARQLPSTEAALNEQGVSVMAGHARTVNSLAVSTDGACLVSGSEDGTARVWDLRSRQPLRVIQSKGPVASVMVLNKPPFLSAGRGNSDAGRKGPKRIQALAALSKHAGVGGGTKSWEGAPIILDGMLGYRGSVVEAGLVSDAASGDVQQLLAAPAGSSDIAAAASLAAETTQMQAQLQEAAQTIKDLRAMNYKLHALITDQTTFGGA